MHQEQDSKHNESSGDFRSDFMRWPSSQVTFSVVRMSPRRLNKSMNGLWPINNETHVYLSVSKFLFIFSTEWFKVKNI